MKRNLLIAGGLITFIIVLFIGVLILYVPVNIDDSMVISNSSNETDEYFYFDNSTPKATAISIARLYDGMMGFDESMVNITWVDASLTSDGKYWIVKMDNGENNWTVVIDNKTLMSKRNDGEWTSLDELKASYIAEMQVLNVDIDGGIGKPYKVTSIEGNVWKVPVYNIYEGQGHVYVDVATGKSKLEGLNIIGSLLLGTYRWKTLKELDDSINNMYDAEPDPPFRNALRDLYP